MGSVVCAACISSSRRFEFLVIMPTSTQEEMEEMPELEEMQPVITPISTVEELEEMFEKQEVQLAPVIISTSAAEEIVKMSEEQQDVRTTSPVPTLITDDSQAMRADTDERLIAPILKVEDPDIDISDEHVEGGDPTEDEGGDESLQHNEVSLPTSTDRKLLIDDFSLSGRRGRGGPEQLRRCISSKPVELREQPVHG